MLNLGACSIKKSGKDNEDRNRKIHTAKINAQLGIAYLERNDVQRAKQKLLLALDQAPNIPEPWYSMGYFLEATGNTQEAGKYYLKAIQLAPRQGEAKNNYGTYLCRTGRYQASIQQFLLAVQDPNYINPAAAYENAGLCALKIPDKAHARIYFEQALSRDSTRSLSRRKLAELKGEPLRNNRSTY